MTLTAVSASAQPKVMQSPAGQGYALVAGGDGFRVESPEGLGVAIEVPELAVLSAFHELEGGWIAAGHVWTEDGSQLVLLRDRAGEIEELPPPPKVELGFRRAPVPLARDGRLWGVAWLEGDGGERNAVMAARWIAGEWGPIETVSPQTGEAQLALSGVVLADGTALLVWAAVVGTDDEILWSRSETAVDSAWTPPRRAHADNEVPDIVPKVTAVDGGALLAWSRYDGVDYRLRVARLDERLGWLDTGFVGEAGSLYPSLVPASAGAAFLYQVAAPQAWAVVELDSDGRVDRRAAMARVAGEPRPLIWLDGPEPIRFPGSGELELEPEAEARSLVWSEQP